MRSVARILPALLVVTGAALASPIVTRDNVLQCLVDDVKYSIQQLQTMLDTNSYVNGLTRAVVEPALRECCAPSAGNPNVTPSTQRMDALAGSPGNPTSLHPNGAPQDTAPCPEDDLDAEAGPNRFAPDHSGLHENLSDPTPLLPSGSPHDGQVEEFHGQLQGTHAANDAPSDFPFPGNQHSSPNAINAATNQAPSDLTLTGDHHSSPADETHFDAEGRPNDSARIGVTRPDSAPTEGPFEQHATSPAEFADIDPFKGFVNPEQSHAEANTNTGDHHEFDASADHQTGDHHDNANASFNGADPDTAFLHNGNITPAGDDSSRDRHDPTFAVPNPSAGDFTPQNHGATAFDPQDHTHISGDGSSPSVVSLIFGQAAAEKVPEGCTCPPS